MDSCFHFDFVKAYGESLKDVTVIFPEDDPDSIIIDGSRQRGYCGYVSESGMSSRIVSSRTSCRLYFLGISIRL